MKTIKTNNVELLLVKVPSDADYNYFPNNGYQIVNTLSKLTEEQALLLVEDCNMYEKCYKKYNKIEMSSVEYIHSTFISKETCFTALESFQSLMSANEVYLEECEYLILIKQ